MTKNDDDYDDYDDEAKLNPLFLGLRTQVRIAYCRTTYSVRTLIIEKRTP